MTFEVTPNKRVDRRHRVYTELSFFRPVALADYPNFKGFICDANCEEEANKALADMGVERAKKWNWKVSTNDFIREQV